MKRLVIALGGNALGSNPQEQLELVKHTAKTIAGTTNVLTTSGITLFNHFSNGTAINARTTIGSIVEVYV